MIELMERTLKPVRELMMPQPLDTEAPSDMAEPETGSVVLPTPDEGPAPGLIMPQEQASEDELFPPEETEQTCGFIDLEWLEESLKILQTKNRKVWCEENILPYMKECYKVEGATILEAAAKLPKGEATHFFNKVQEALKKVQEAQEPLM